MTKEQKLDIERWINLQKMRYEKVLYSGLKGSDTYDEGYAEGKRDAFLEIIQLLNGTLIVNNDYTELRPAKGSEPEVIEMDDETFNFHYGSIKKDSPPWER